MSAVTLIHPLAVRATITARRFRQRTVPCLACSAGRNRPCRSAEGFLRSNHGLRKVTYLVSLLRARWF